jgi:hypothetical protein
MVVPFDMKDAILSPETLDFFLVIRQTQTLNSNGRAVFKQSLPIAARGTVTPFVPDSLRRETDMQTEYKALSITTPFLLRGPAIRPNDPNIYGPDIIVWNNDKYLVTALDDYSNYNPGYVKVIAVSLDYIDNSPQGVDS